MPSSGSVQGTRPTRHSDLPDPLRHDAPETLNAVRLSVNATNVWVPPWAVHSVVFGIREIGRFPGLPGGTPSGSGDLDDAGGGISPQAPKSNTHVTTSFT